MSRLAAVVAVAALVALLASDVARSNESHTEIYSVAPNGSGLTDLSQNAANDSFPVESPRGGRIAFISDRDGYDAVYLMNDDGSDQRRVSSEVGDSPTTKCRLGEPAWSPSGRSIAVTAFCMSLYGDPRDILTSIYLVPSSGGPTRELVPGGASPMFSADGRFVAYLSQSNVISPVYVGYLSVASGGPFNLGVGSAPAWSPAGHRLAFAAEGEGVTVVDAARPSRRWTFANKTAGGPAWSPSGRLLAFSLGGAHPGIYTVRPGRRRAVRLVDLGEGARPSWSPNGRWLALAGETSAYLVARDGRFLQRIGGTAFASQWSPNSSRIAWNDPSLGGLVATNPRNRETIGVVSAATIVGVTWTRDGRRVVFGADAGLGSGAQARR